MTFDPQDAGACLAGWETLGCELFGDWSLLPAACETVTIPHVEEGGECARDAECVTGECVDAEFEPDGSLALYGRCVTPGEVGQPCPELVCVEGAYCEVGDPSECVAQKPAGQPCTYFFECASGFCDDSQGAGVCAPSGQFCNGS